MLFVYASGFGLTSAVFESLAANDAPPLLTGRGGSTKGRACGSFAPPPRFSSLSATLNSFRTPTNQSEHTNAKPDDPDSDMEDSKLRSLAGTDRNLTAKAQLSLGRQDERDTKEDHSDWEKQCRRRPHSKTGGR
jgi:hypothetical protein